MHDITRISTIFTISNGIAKTPRDNFDRRSKSAKNVQLMLDVFCYLLDELRCNEIRLRRVKYDFVMRNSYAVKYLLRKCEGRISFHIERSEIFHNFRKGIISHSAKAEYFTFSCRPIYFSPFLWYNTTNR